MESSIAFTKSLTTDEAWLGIASALLQICSDMMGGDKPQDMQGGFMFSCWFMLMRFECNRHRTTVLLERISDTDGERVGDVLPYLVEGQCIIRSLAPAFMNEATKCASENSLDFSVLQEAKDVYELFIEGSDNFTEPTPNDLSMVRQQLDNFNDTIRCTLQEIGAINDGKENGLDFDQMREILDNSAAKKDDMFYAKLAALELVNSCEKMRPETPYKFVECWFAGLPYACASLHSHYITAAPKKPKRRRRPAGCGGRQRGGRKGGKRRRKQRPQTTTAEPQIPTMAVVEV